MSKIKMNEMIRNHRARDKAPAPLYDAVMGLNPAETCRMLRAFFEKG